MGSERGTNPSGANLSLVGWCGPGYAMDKAIPKYDVAWLGFASALGVQQIPATTCISSGTSAWAASKSSLQSWAAESPWPMGGKAVAEGRGRVLTAPCSWAHTCGLDRAVGKGQAPRGHH